jgi:hypothetical protein
MRININYGEIHFKPEKVVIGTNVVSKITGGFLIAVILGTSAFMTFIGVKGVQWWTIFKSTWFLVAIMLWMGLRYLGGWSDRMVIDKRTHEITTTKKWLFIPYKVTKYPFKSVKSVVWENVSSTRKSWMDTQLTQVTLELKKNEWLGIGGVSYPEPGKSNEIGKNIANLVAEFIGAPVRELKPKKS